VAKLDLPVAKEGGALPAWSNRVKPSQSQSNQSTPVKPDQTQSNRIKPAGAGEWPKLDLPVAKEAGGIQPGQTQSNRVKPVKPGGLGDYD
jgi:hypothetical protein